MSGSELHPANFLLVDNSNDQCHDAALTVVEHSHGQREVAVELLQMVGLVGLDEDGALRPIGVDAYELSWFTPAYHSPEM
jgi:hypothetical protein